MPELTKQQKMDAAVAIVQHRAAIELEAEPSGLLHEYIDPWTIATELERQGVLVREDGPGWRAQDKAIKRLEGQARRLLDEEARKPDARILRFSSADNKALPRLDGGRRGFNRAGIGYTTPELHERAVAAVEARVAREKAEREEMADLLARARAADGFPVPTGATTTAVTFDADGLRKLLEGWT